VAIRTSVIQTVVIQISVLNAEPPILVTRVLALNAELRIAVTRVLVQPWVVPTSVLIQATRISAPIGVQSVVQNVQSPADLGHVFHHHQA
jgi:hypothetical protein